MRRPLSSALRYHQLVHDRITELTSNVIEKVAKLAMEKKKDGQLDKGVNRDQADVAEIAGQCEVDLSSHGVGLLAQEPTMVSRCMEPGDHKPDGNKPSKFLRMTCVPCFEGEKSER